MYEGITYLLARKQESKILERHHSLITLTENLILDTMI